jgi:hypothetical protein
MTRHRLWWTLMPETTSDPRAVFEIIRDELEKAAIGVPGETIRRLALIGAEHLAGVGGARVVLRGPGGSGKTHVSQLLAEILDRPVLRINAGILSEQNWSGFDLSDAVAQLRNAIPTDLKSVAEYLTARAVVIVEDFDYTRLASTYSSASTRDYRQGKQNSIAALLKGEPIPSAGFGPAEPWSAKDALVIMNGRFDELGALTTAEDYADWGIMGDLAGQLARAHTFFLTPPTAHSLQVILERMTPAFARRFNAFGYRLQVPPETISFVMRWVSSTRVENSVAVGQARVEQAAASLLIDALQERRAPGTVLILAPDHIRTPPPARGFWRE